MVAQAAPEREVTETHKCRRTGGTAYEALYKKQAYDRISDGVFNSGPIIVVTEKYEKL